MDFETLCFNLFGIKRPFKKDGTLSESGSRAYGRLLNALYDMQDMGILTDCTAVIDKLDFKIDNQKKATKDVFLTGEEEEKDISFDGEMFEDDNFNDPVTMGI